MSPLPKFSSRKVCLVTGGAGFIGSHLVDLLLEKGWYVKVLDIAEDISNLKKSPKLEYIRGSILDKRSVNKAVSGCQLVFHLAAKTDFNCSDYSVYQKINVQGSVNIANTCLKYKVRKLIFFSSIATHGVYSTKNTQDENIDYPPSSLYGSSKLEAETKLFSLYHDHKLPLVVIRPTTVYGPREKMTTFPFIKLLSTIPPIVVGKGTNLVSYVYVLDLVKAAYLASQTENVLGEIFVISGPTSITMKKLILAILKSLKKNTQLFHFPYILLYIPALFLGFLKKHFNFPSPLYPSRLNTLVMNYDFSIAKAKNKLKYKPVYNIESGMKESVAWYKSNGYL